MAWTEITNGTKPDADEVMGNFYFSTGFDFKFFVLTNMLFEDNSLTVYDYYNNSDFEVIVKRLSTSSEYDSVNSGSNVYYESTYKLIIVASLYDDFEDGTIDTTKWTYTTGVSESGGVITFGGTNDLVTNGTSGFNGKNGGTFIVDYNSTDSATSSIEITDGTNSLTLLNLGSRALVEIYFDVSNNKVYYRTRPSGQPNWSNWSSGLDVSTLTNWYVKFSSTSATVTLYTTYYVQSSLLNQDIVLEDLSLKYTPNKLIFTPIEQVNGSTISYYVSNDSGTSYTQISKDNYETKLTLSNKTLKFKITVTTSSTKPYYLDTYGVYVE